MGTICFDLSVFEGIPFEVSTETTRRISCRVLPTLGSRISGTPELGSDFWGSRQHSCGWSKSCKNPGDTGTFKTRRQMTQTRGSRKKHTPLEACERPHVNRSTSQSGCDSLLFPNDFHKQLVKEGCRERLGAPKQGHKARLDQQRVVFLGGRMHPWRCARKCTACR